MAENDGKDVIIAAMSILVDRAGGSIVIKDVKQYEGKLMNLMAILNTDRDELTVSLSSAQIAKPVSQVM